MIYGVMSLDTSIFVIHITGDFQKRRGLVRSAILATAGPQSCFGLERKWGEFGLELVPSPCVMGVLGQSKVNLTRRTVEPLTL